MSTRVYSDFFRMDLCRVENLVGKYFSEITINFVPSKGVHISVVTVVTIRR